MRGGSPDTPRSAAFRRLRASFRAERNATTSRTKSRNAGSSKSSGAWPRRRLVVLPERRDGAAEPDVPVLSRRPAGRAVDPVTDVCADGLRGPPAALRAAPPVSVPLAGEVSLSSSDDDWPWRRTCRTAAHACATHTASTCARAASDCADSRSAAAAASAAHKRSESAATSPIACWAAASRAASLGRRCLSAETATPAEGEGPASCDADREARASSAKQTAAPATVVRRTASRSNAGSGGGSPEWRAPLSGDSGGVNEPSVACTRRTHDSTVPSADGWALALAALAPPLALPPPWPVALVAANAGGGTGDAHPLNGPKPSPNPASCKLPCVKVRSLSVAPSPDAIEAVRWWT